MQSPPEPHFGILVHPGNLAGEPDAGFATDSENCWLPGVDFALFKAGAQVGRHKLTKDQWGVASSDATWLLLKSHFNAGNFVLKVR